MSYLTILRYFFHFDTLLHNNFTDDEEKGGHDVRCLRFEGTAAGFDGIDEYRLGAAKSTSGSASSFGCKGGANQQGGGATGGRGASMNDSPERSGEHH